MICVFVDASIAGSVDSRYISRIDSTNRASQNPAGRARAIEESLQCARMHTRICDRMEIVKRVRPMCVYFVALSQQTLDDERGETTMHRRSVNDACAAAGIHIRVKVD